MHIQISVTSLNWLLTISIGTEKNICLFLIYSPIEVSMGNNNGAIVLTLAVVLTH